MTNETKIKNQKKYRRKKNVRKTIARVEKFLGSVELVVQNIN